MAKQIGPHKETNKNDQSYIKKYYLHQLLEGTPIKKQTSNKNDHSCAMCAFKNTVYININNW